MQRRCLDCNRLIARGSRCDPCARAYRSPYSRHRWAAEVKALAGGRCQDCGSSIGVEAHHVVSLGRGGADTLANGRALCADCHREMHR